MFSPRWYYRGTLPDDNQKQITDAFGIFLSDDKNFSNRDEWNCNVLTTYQSPHNDEAPWSVFLEMIRPVVDEFMESMRPKIDLTVKPQEGWANKYLKGHYQEHHCHSVPFCNLALVYFYQQEDDECPYFKFYNSQYPQYKASGLDDAFELPTAPIITPKAKQGDVIIFPAHYPHLVSPNKGDSVRITLSANLFVMPDDKPSTES